MVPSEFAKAAFLNRATTAITARNRNHFYQSHWKIFIRDIHVFAILLCFLEVVRLFHLCLTCEISLQLCQMGDTRAKLLGKRRIIFYFVDRLNLVEDR